MKKSKLALVLLLSLFTVGCTTKNIQNENDSSVYISNLTDESSLSYVTEMMKEAGIKSERISAFTNQVKRFNETVSTEGMYGDFTPAYPLEFTYDPFDLQEEWYAKFPDFVGYNCRLTAYTLFGDFAKVPKGASYDDFDLFMDCEALDYDDSALCGDSRDKFLALFSTISTDDTKDVATHYANVIKSFNDRDISFDSETVKLVTVWIHNKWTEEGDQLFVGHTGVIIQTKEGDLFVEKLAFQEPYRAIKLGSRRALYDYLMGKYANQWGQETADPFIMVEDGLLTFD